MRLTRSGKTRAVALCVGLAPCLLAQPALAAKHKHEHEHRHHEAHEHGSGQLNVALDGQNLFIELIVPAINVVGFEHPARTEAEHAAVKDAKARFSKVSSLFTLPEAAGCTSTDVHVSLGQLGDEDHAHEKEHGHGHGKKHDHDDDHGHAKKHDHDKDHGHDHDKKHGHGHKHGDHAKHEGDEEQHSELTAEYEFKCNSPKALTSIGLGLFPQFKDLEELEARIVTGSQQAAVDVDADAATIELSP